MKKRLRDYLLFCDKLEEGKHTFFILYLHFLQQKGVGQWETSSFGMRGYSRGEVLAS
jgi:hypothetical protein